MGGAGKIRLFPKEWVACTRILGNAAYNGAVGLLLDERLHARCLQAVAQIQAVDLSANANFVEEYAEGMLFE